MGKDNSTKKYTPIKFYKYRSMDAKSMKWVERTICHNEIFFAPASTFNDPFDLRPVFSLDAPKATQKADYIRLSKKFEPHLGRKERRADVRRVLSTSLRKENIQQTLDAIQQAHAEIITTKVGVLCVSTKRDDILMWSHYGDSHRGICLEFDGLLPFMAHAQEVAMSRPQLKVEPVVEMIMRPFSTGLMQAAFGERAQEFGRSHASV